MSFISYAQNGEDVILWRALRHIETGFYIDIGACDPDELSVTRAFYERGWSGINVEPSREYFERCALARPRDTNLNMAVTAVAGPVRFLNVPGTGLSTIVDNVAEAATARGRAVETREVRGVTLADICAMAGGSDIHFLKIDVEGAEQAVLQGGDFVKFRPWIVVVEATVPGSSERSEHNWEPLLLQAGYDRCLFDGLNLYYLARERAELAPQLTSGANVLDDYEPVVQVEARRLLDAARAWGDGLQAAIAERDVLLATTQEHLAAALAQGEAALREQVETRRLLDAARAWGDGLQDAIAERDALLATTQEHLAAALAQGEAAMVRAQGEAADLRVALTQAETAYAEAAARIAVLTREWQDQQDAVEVQQAQLTSLRKQQANLRKALYNERHVHEALRNDLEEVRAALSQETGRAALLRARLEHLASASGDELQQIPLGEGDGPLERLASQIAGRAEEAAMLRAALEETSRRIDGLTGSTSWRITAPIRATRRILAPPPPRPAPAAETPDPKELARRMFHGGMRVVLRTPGSRRGVSLLRNVAPAPVEWLARRFRAYEQRATAALAPPAPAAETPPPELPVEPEALPMPPDPVPADVVTAAAPPEPASDLSDEEARIHRQLMASASSPASMNRGF